MNTQQTESQNNELKSKNMPESDMLVVPDEEAAVSPDPIICHALKSNLWFWVSTIFAFYPLYAFWVVARRIFGFSYNTSGSKKGYGLFFLFPRMNWEEFADQEEEIGRLALKIGVRIYDDRDRCPPRPRHNQKLQSFFVFVFVNSHVFFTVQCHFLC